MRGCDRTRGQALPFVALELWLIAAVAVVVLMLGARAADRARAQAAADATALAAAAGGDPDVIAAANGATIDRIQEGLEVDVVVSVGATSAAARASAPRPQWHGLDPRLQNALARAEVALGQPVAIVSGVRSRADQQRLWDQRETNPYPVAPPGTSLHELGLAVDVPLDLARRLAPLWAITGLCQPLPHSDPVHFTLC